MGQVDVPFLALTSLMAPSNQNSLNPTGKPQIGSSAEIPGYGVGNTMLSDPTPAHKCTRVCMSPLLPLGGKFLDEFISSLWFPFSGILLV